ncbi:MAG: type II toxin-antitoxin system VapC family toxin [Verrucomicrobiae bacterium]|nr:type II toxin-antitoxin system VapC family toxin [Verrucomicrobiae bacterium]
MICCDTSFAAKLYVPEPESAAVRQRLETEDEVFLSELARPELMGVFHRRLREGKWTRADFLAAVHQFSLDDLGGFWTWLPLAGPIVAAAANTYVTLPETVFLRAADCLHLVTALHHNFAQIHTYDVHQTRAATALGIQAVMVG